MLVPAAYAQADWRVDHPSDPGWAVLDSNRTKIAMCDAQADGHETWVRYWTMTDPSHKDFTWESTQPTADSYGRDSAGRFCTYFDAGFGGREVWTFRVCVTNEGCSGWKNTGYGTP